MMKPLTRIACLSFVAALGTSLAHAQPVTITPMSSFGGGDGNLTIAEANVNAAANGLTAGSILSDGHFTRGMAYNPANGNLIVVNRSGGNHINVLSSSGNFIRRLSAAGMNVGAIHLSMVSASADGQIFVGNVATTGNFRLYRFANDAVTTAAELVFDGSHGGPRAGDNLDVIGSGQNVRVVTGHGTSTGRGYLLLNQTGPSTFAPTIANFGTTVAGDYRLGIAFSHGGTRVLGAQGTGAIGTGRFFVSDPNSNPPAHLGIATINWQLERFLDSAFINGFHMLATSDTDRARIRIYNIDNVLNPVFRTDFQMFTSAIAENPNATGSVQWGSINGKDATLYVMNTNQGIQAYNVEVVPEPATLLALGAGVAALVARRRRKSA